MRNRLNALEHSTNEFGYVIYLLTRREPLIVLGVLAAFLFFIGLVSPY